MSTLRSLARRYARWRDDSDPYLMATTLALAGEPGLAREILVEREKALPCCGAVEEGDDCRRIAEARCTLAVELRS